MSDENLGAVPPTESLSQQDREVAVRISGMLKEKNYTNLVEPNPQDEQRLTNIVSAVVSNLEEDHLVLRFTTSLQNRTKEQVLNTFNQLAPEEARLPKTALVVKPKDDDDIILRFTNLLRKTAEHSNKPVVVVIENIDELIGTSSENVVRTAMAIQREGIEQEDGPLATFLITGNTYPTQWVESTSRTSYDSAETIVL